MMRLKELFTVPENQKITEKQFLRVLASSVCGILLCISCLVGTTWAWFSLEISSQENVIQLGTFFADTQITSAAGSGVIQSARVDPATNGFTYYLLPGEYTVSVFNASGSTAAGYCIVMVDDKSYKTVQLDSAGEEISFLLTVQPADEEKLAQLSESNEENAEDTQLAYVSVVTIVPTWGMPVSENALLGSAPEFALTGEALTPVKVETISEDLAEPADPDASEQPEEPEELSDPDASEQPEEPEEPFDPDASEQPEEPKEPSDPEASEQPGEPEEPSDPEASEQPGEPEEPSDPDATAQSEGNDNPAEAE